MTEPTGMDAGGEEREDDATRLVPSAVFTQPVTSAPAGSLPDDFDSTIPPASAPPAPPPPPASQPAPVKSVAPGARMAPGQILGHTYEIEAHLARGGMGEVYRARHIELGSLHAIKVILPELAEDPKIISLFQEEARKLSRVRNDAIVSYEGLFRDENGVRYLVMEFVDGTSLSRIIRQGPLPVEAVRQLRDRCAMGLAAAHEKGIFHRDIAPDNILLVDNRPELAKIIDFGIAKSSDPGDKTIIGQDFAGKYSYVSPEQLGLFGGHVDGRSDIYSLGLVLVAAAAGRALDMGNSPVSVIEARRAVPDLSSVPEALRAELAPLIEPDPANRPQSMRSLPGSRPAEETGGWSAGTAARAAEPAGPAATAGDRTALGKPADPEKPSGRRGLAIAAAIGAFLLVLGGGAFFLFQGKPAPTPVAVNPPDQQRGSPPSSPSTGTTPVAPPQPAPSLAAVNVALAALPCANVSAAAANGSISMTGFVASAGDLQRLAQIAQSAGIPSVVTADVQVYQKPLCDLAKLFVDNPRLKAISRPDIAFDNPSRLYHDGAQIVVTATAPADGGGFLYVDYFATDNTVVHMLPTPRVTRNQIAAAGSMTIGTLNATAKPNEDRFAVAPPYGPTMIVTMITSKPIFDRVRPPQENAADYLKDLSRRLLLDSSGASPLVAGGYETFDVEP